MSDPENEIYVRTDLFDGLAREVTGDRLFLNKRMDMAEYQRAIALGQALRERLEQWGWKPRDMVDVQSFMWQGLSALERAEKEPEKPGTRDREDGYAGGAGHTRDLQEILDLLEADGFHFPPDLVANYILALQTKRFVILTGISGTGKTRLAMKVAQFYAGYDDVAGDAADRVLVVAVRPDWTDPRGLTGYYNPIADHYLTTDFLRLLLSARSEESAAKMENRPARPFFVILDEMNLARVEHYFSDFLSALESQRPLSLHHGSAEMYGPEGEIAVPGHLRIPRNVFFTGTVNVDETTHMFSPKVLDRAFTLELNEVDLDGWAIGETDRPGTSNALHLSALEAGLRWNKQPGAEEWREFGERLDGKLREAVTGLNAALASTGYHFGYRVAAEIASFVLLAHKQGAESDQALWNALDLAVLEKVLPKFHGTEQELEMPLRIVAFAAVHGRAPTVQEMETQQAGAGTVSEEEPQMPRCASKVRRMQQRLASRGFAAFIE